VISAYPLGTLRKMAYSFAKMIIGPLMAKHVRAVARSSQALLCWQVITNSTQNALPVPHVVHLSEMARVMRSLSDPSYTAGCATNGRCSHSTGLRIIRSPGNRIASDWSKYHPVRPIRISREESNSH